jgi:hypothetical protein
VEDAANEPRRVSQQRVVQETPNRLGFILFLPPCCHLKLFLLHFVALERKHKEQVYVTVVNTKTYLDKKIDSFNDKVGIGEEDTEFITFQRRRYKILQRMLSIFIHSIIHDKEAIKG